MQNWGIYFMLSLVPSLLGIKNLCIRNLCIAIWLRLILGQKNPAPKCTLKFNCLYRVITVININIFVTFKMDFHEKSIVYKHDKNCNRFKF